MKAEWMRQALVGVDSAPRIPRDGPLGELLTHVMAQQDDPALGFSRAAGAIGACSRAALTLEKCSALPDAAAPDPTMLDPAHAWVSALADSLAHGPLRLQHEACARLAAMHAVLPARLLPLALDAAQRSKALRVAVVAVIGHRGAWLVQFNPDWDFARGGNAGTFDAIAQWEEGSPTQRLAWLRDLRARDPAAARELLRAQLGELPAKERLELLGALGDVVYEDDAALLEPLLKDRSRDVRQHAARLLATLPGTPLAQRMTGWLSALLSVKRGLLRTTWSCDAPAAADPEWATAAIDAVRPQHDALGERAWWLFQLVRYVPLSWWVAHTGMQPAELIAWAARSDWKAALARGWRQRVERADRDWIAAMLGARDVEFVGDRAALLALLPVAQREQHWPRSLQQFVASGEIGNAIYACAPDETLSQEFSRALATDLPQLIGGEALRNDYALRALLPDLMTLLHPACLASIELPPRRGDESPALVECLAHTERVLAARRTLNSSFPSSTPESR